MGTTLGICKGHWEIIKKNLSEDELKNHPARFALVEISNVHDEGITFEPIHRVYLILMPKTFLKV